MDNPVAVAISRQFGSGGSYVGQRVAERLGFAYLDRELLQRAAAVLGVEENAVERLDERRAGFWEEFFGVLAHGGPDSYSPPPMRPLHEDVLRAEAAIMLSLAGRRDCVVVGRGATHFLRDHPGVVTVFLHAPFEARATRVQEVYRLGSLESARALVEETDAARDRFLCAVAGKRWTDARNYHLCVDTGARRFEEAVAAVVALVRERVRTR